MLAHRFQRPETSDLDQADFLKEVRRGTFRGLYETFVGKLLCFVRMHVRVLQGDDAGFYHVCDRCGHYEPSPTLWKNEIRSRKPNQLNK